MMLCAKLVIGSLFLKNKKIFFKKQRFLLCLSLSWKSALYFWIRIAQRCVVISFGWNWPCNSLKVINDFLLFLYLFTLEKGVGLHLIKHKFPLSKEAFSKVWFKLPNCSADETENVNATDKFRLGYFAWKFGAWGAKKTIRVDTN